MKLCYSIDALSPSGSKAWRLQQDGSWRPCTYAEPLQDHDACITDKETAEYWSGQRLKKDRKQGLKPVGKAGRFDFWMRDVFAHAVTHHLAAPATPDLEEMTELIASLPPGRPWLIYLDVHGHFRALDSEHEPIIGNVDIAVRGEIASSADYVGPAAVANAHLIDETYRQFLAGWLEHLNTANTGIFVPDASKLEDTAHYLERITQWQPRR